jgi:hypothetical protein
MVGKFKNREKYATKVQVVCWDFSVARFLKF